MNTEKKLVTKEYAAPTLAVHGKLAELTAAGGTSTAENLAGRRA